MPHSPAVSIVVPVYAPGPYIRPLLDSLDAQEPPEGGFEAVFADDGSPDASADLLEAWARPRPWARVIRLPHSGWPSRPRNVGIAEARGEYVFFVDHDDRLADDALQRMTAFASAHGPDVVVGRMAGLGRHVPSRLFAHTVVDARAPETPLQASMTVHAMFRAAFLSEHGIRFDDTLTRLEDHVFMARRICPPCGSRCSPIPRSICTRRAMTARTRGTAPTAHGSTTRRSRGRST